MPWKWIMGLEKANNFRELKMAHWTEDTIYIITSRGGWVAGDVVV